MGYFSTVGRMFSGALMVWIVSGFLGQYTESYIPSQVKPAKVA